MATSRNWSQVTAPKTKPQPSQSPASSASSSSQPNNRTRARKNRKRRQKQRKQPWPNLNHKTAPNPSNYSNKTTSSTSPTKSKHKNQTPSVSFAALTSKSQKFAPTANAYDALSVSSQSTHHTNNTSSTQISKQELHKREQQRHSALHTLKQEWIHTNKDIFACNAMHGVKNRGIFNRTVDCYINAIIQSLLSLPLLVDIFSSIKYAKSAANIGPFTKALFDTIHMFNISHSTSNKNAKYRRNNKNPKQMNDINYNETIYSTVHHPQSLLSILDRFRYSIGTMSNGQQDAQEFLGYIIANLHDEMSWNTNKNKSASHSTCSLETSPYKKTQKRTANVQKATQYEEEKNEWQLVTKNVHCKTSIAHKLKMHDSLISMLFGGEYYQMIRYLKGSHKKSKPSVSYQPFFTISLDINDYKIKSVSSALQNHFSKPHIIEYKKSVANKSELIAQCPQYLILHLKRFLFEDGHIYKLHKYISYDTKLSIAPHLLFDKSKMKTAGNMKKLRYELRSVIVHEGDFVTHGHYISYCRREDFYMNKINKNRKHQWIKFNDDKVKSCIDINTIKKQQAYVLIYQKLV